MPMNDLNKLMLGSGLSGLGTGLGSMLFGGHQKSPGGAAQKYYGQIPDLLKQYLNPYAEMGQNLLPGLQNQYNNLLNDPAALLNKLGSGYTQSPGYQFQVDQATKGVNQASAAGGMAGSPQSQQQMAEVINGIANQDFSKYLQNALGLFGTGLQGIQGLQNQGAQGAGSLAEMLSQSLMNQGNLAYENQAAKNQQKGNNLGSIFGGLGSILPFLFG